MKGNARTGDFGCYALSAAFVCDLLNDWPN